MFSQVDGIIISLISTYKSLPEQVIEDVVNDAMYLYIRLRRCSEDTTFTNGELNWIKRASKEFLDRQQLEIPLGVSEYSESVYKLKFDSTSISADLRNEVTPLAKVYKFNSSTNQDEVEEVE